MVAMAKEMIEKKVILGFIVPKELKYFKDGLSKVKPGSNFLTNIKYPTAPTNITITTTKTIFAKPL